MGIKPQISLVTSTPPRVLKSDRAKKKDQPYYSAGDYENSNAALGEVEPLADDVVHRARKQCAIKAASIDEAAELMRMLGIHPDQEGTPQATLAPAQFNHGNQY